MVSWNATVDARLLVGILHTAKPKLDHEALAQFVGEGATAKAVSHRIQNLKKKANVSTTDGAPESPKSPANSPSKSPPKKRGRPAKVKDAVTGAEKDDEPASKKVKGGSTDVDGEVSTS